MPAPESVTYTSYLKIDGLLQLQKPLSTGPEHDELLFIIIHQTYELWFKSLIHELTKTQEYLASGESHRALALLGRARTIMKTLVSQVDILETMTPLQFNSFRDRLDSSSGFQSVQFREFEAIMGRRDPGMSAGLPVDGPARTAVAHRASQPSLWDSTLSYLMTRSYSFPAEIMLRDANVQYEPSEEVQAILVEVYRSDAEAALVLERLIDLDEGVQEWRYRHVKMVERTIGTKQGTGGSSGAAYLSSTLFRPSFPDLWAIRNAF